MESMTKVNYNVRKIATGYLVDYWLDGIGYEHAFETWKETLDFLKNNPPKFLIRDYVDADLIEEVA